MLGFSGSIAGKTSITVPFLKCSKNVLYY